MKAEQPKASLRGRLTGDFIASLQAQWSEHGDAVLNQLRVESPGKFSELVSRLCPTEAVVTQGNAFDGMSMQEIEDYLIEGMASNVQAYERMLQKARKLVQSRQGTAPPETATEHRARIAKEARQQIPWARSG